MPLHARGGPGLAVTFLGPVHDPEAGGPGAASGTAGRSRWRRAKRAWRPDCADAEARLREIVEDGAMSRRGDTHRVMRWLWTSRRPDARLARLALLPVSGLWRLAMDSRRLAYRRGWIPVRDLPLPSVAVGNLTVGGSGKTPIAIWIARHYVAARPHAGHPAPGLRRRRDPGAPARRARGGRGGRSRSRGRAPSGRWPTARRCWCWTTPTSGSTSAATSTSW